MILMRYADDIVVGFEHEADARCFWDDMRRRFEEFSLSLNPDKTRLIEFGRFAADRRAHRGLGKPETFNFLGFTFICERNSRGQFLVKRTTRRDRMRATLRKIKEELRRRMHQPIPEQGTWLKQVVRGFFAYHAVPTNGAALRAFYYYVERIWLRTLRRRSQKDRSRGSECTSWPPTGSRNRESFIRILTSVSPSCTQGGSRVRESRLHGFGRGAVSNDRPYRASLQDLPVLTDPQ
jgi:Reverse transcriptase (RNA-dependent DNA polymerase)